ncbi:MAG: hypothetical protein WDZ45_11240 [Flavobacteriaceae bacterium]
MLNITLSKSPKALIAETLNNNIEKLKSNETNIKSVSNKLDFDVTFEPLNDSLELPIKVEALENLQEEVLNLLPKTVYISNVRFK